MANLSKGRDAKLEGLPFPRKDDSQLPNGLAFFAFLEKLQPDNSKPAERQGRKAKGPSLRKEDGSQLPKEVYPCASYSPYF